MPFLIVAVICFEKTVTPAFRDIWRSFGKLNTNVQENMDNIWFGNPAATDEEVIAAAKAVGADDFICRLTNGYETEVEEWGNILSVGERQLLSFSRALLANPKIIILAEAIASIDTETEIKIQTALQTLLMGRTSIIIAHRLSTIRDCDMIYVLENGVIKEQSNHQHLMNHKGHYFHLIEVHIRCKKAPEGTIVNIKRIIGSTRMVW